MTDNQLEVLPMGLGSLESLEELELSRNNLVTLPGDLQRCPRLGRIDLRYNREADRFGELLTTRVLPANERRQSVYGRWDNMPTESVDGGDGRWENSPGDWLLPYWMARYYGILA